MDGLTELHRHWPMLSSVIEHIPIEKLVLIEHLCSIIRGNDDQTYIHISQLLRNHYQVNVAHQTVRLLSTMFGRTIPNFFTSGNHMEIINSFSLSNNLPFFSTIHLSSCYTQCILCNANLCKYTLQSVRVYHDDGKRVNGVIKVFSCSHSHTTLHDQSPVYYLPNYTCQLSIDGKYKRVFHLSDFFSTTINIFIWVERRCSNAVCWCAIWPIYMLAEKPFMHTFNHTIIDNCGHLVISRWMNYFFIDLSFHLLLSTIISGWVMKEWSFRRMSKVINWRTSSIDPMIASKNVSFDFGRVITCFLLARATAQNWSMLMGIGNSEDKSAWTRVK